jgi:Uma2 family endonuclease
VLFEVLSDSTEEYDRGEKFENYKSIPSLAEYVLVYQNERRLEVFSRSDGWTMHSAGPGQSIAIRAIDTELSVDEIFAE